MKITFRILISLFAVINVLYGCRPDNSSDDLLRPWKAPDIKLKSDALIGAYYNLSFNDTNWLNIDQLYLPTLGKYNSGNAGVIQQHIEWSLQSGIDFWICAQDRNTDSMLVNVFPGISGTENIKVALDLNLSNLAAVSAIDLTDSASIRKVVSEFRNMKPVFDLSNYLKIDGKPVIIVQNAYSYLPRPNYVAGDTEDARVAAIADLRSQLKDSTGYDYYFIGNYIGWFPPDRYPDYILSFDALTCSMFSDRKAVTNFYNENIDLNWANWKSYLEGRSIPFVPSVFPGRNDTITSQSDVLPRSETFFSDNCNVAKKYIDENLRIILINSFNNWSSGTQIEPADTYGNTYIDIIRNEFTVN